MKRKHLIAVAVLAGVIGAGIFAAKAHAQVGNAWQHVASSFSETVSANRALPTGTCSSTGISLAGVTDLHAIEQCSDNSPFTGGAFDAYFCDPMAGTWGRANSANAMDFTVGALTTYADAGAPVFLGPEVKISYPFGQVAYVSVGVGCAGAHWDGGINSTVVAVQQ